MINRRLADQFGEDGSGQPIYRVVWSAEETERRLGEFHDYLPGTNILLRVMTEVREVKKYPYLDPQWVLEKLMVNPHPDELVGTGTLSPQKLTYEPMWTFGFEPNGLPKEPIWRAMEFLIEMSRNPEVLSPAAMSQLELEKAEKDDAAMRELLDASIRNDPFHSSVQDGDTILLNDATRKSCPPQ